MAVEHDVGWGRKVRHGRMWLDVVRGGRRMCTALPPLLFVYFKNMKSTWVQVGGHFCSEVCLPLKQGPHSAF